MKKYTIELDKNQLQFLRDSTKQGVIKVLEKSHDSLDIVEVNTYLEILEQLFEVKEK